MVQIGWIQLSETPGVELVLGQVARLWRLLEASIATPATPNGFLAFDRPGFAKIATGLQGEWPPKVFGIGESKDRRTDNARRVDEILAEGFGARRS